MPPGGDVILLQARLLRLQALGFLLARRHRLLELLRLLLPRGQFLLQLPGFRTSQRAAITSCCNCRCLLLL